MQRCTIDGSAIFEDEDGNRLLCLAAGHVYRDEVSTLQKALSNATPETNYGETGESLKVDFGPRESLRPEWVAETIRRVYSQTPAVDLDAALDRLEAMGQ